jgi:hypothetical protein
MSTEGETRLRPEGLVYRGRDSSTGRDSSAEGKTHLRIGRLAYGGGDLSKEG